MNTYDKMRWILFMVFLVLFVVVTVCTLSAVFFQIGSPTPEERSLLLKVFVVEIGLAVIALFYGLFGLKRGGRGVSQEDINEAVPSNVAAMPIVYSSEFHSTLWDSLGHHTLVVFGLEPQGILHPRVSPNDLRAAHLISLFLASAYPGRSAVPIASATAGWQNLLRPDTSLVLVGGFVTNPEYATQIPRLMRYWSLKMGRICEQANRRCFHVGFDSLPPGLTAVPRHDPRQVDDIPSEHVGRDYALVTATAATLYEAQRGVVSVAGIKGPGTVGGAGYITAEAMLKDLEYYLNDKVNSSDMLELLVRVDANAGVVNSTTLVGVVINGQCLLQPREEEWEPCEHTNSCNECTFGNEPSYAARIDEDKRLPLGAIIFDLDDTLVDTYETLITTQEVNAASHLCSERECPFSAGEASSFLLSLRRRSPHKMSEEIQARYPQFAADLERAREHSLQDLDVSMLRLKDGAIALLKDASRLYDVYLITEGSREFQESKLKQLGISSYFKKVIFVSTEEGDSKEDALAHITASTDYPHEHVAVVGNRVDNEIRIGNELGLTTVWMKCGEGSDMAPDRDAPPHHIVEDIRGIRSLVSEPRVLWHSDIRSMPNKELKE